MSGKIGQHAKPKQLSLPTRERTYMISWIGQTINRFDIYKQRLSGILLVYYCSPLSTSDHRVLSFPFQCCIDFVVPTSPGRLQHHKALRDASQLFQRYCKRSIRKSKWCEPTMEQNVLLSHETASFPTESPNIISEKIREEHHYQRIFEMK